MMVAMIYSATTQLSGSFHQMSNENVKIFQL